MKEPKSVEFIAGMKMICVFFSFGETIGIDRAVFAMAAD